MTPRPLPRWLRRVWGDTLGKRLFLLLWVALVVSHLAAFGVLQLMHNVLPRGPAGAGFGLPTFPSLPPTPGLPGLRAPMNGPPPGLLPQGDVGMPPPHGLDERGFEHDGAPGTPPPFANHRRGGLPLTMLLIDYGVRLLVIALAAWWGSRWLAQPMRRLVGASHTLAGSLARDGALPLLDEQAGTLEVREAASVFNQMASRLREQFKGRELMFAAISHDLRTPLTRLRMRLEAMDADAALQQRSIADVREMDALIDSVLTVFRGSGGAGTEPAFDIDVAALAQSLADDRQEQGQAVALGPLSAPAVARAQPAALRRIVDNLVDNALRYAGSATLSVLQGPGCVELRVEDEGPGIPPEALEAVCQPFFRLEGSRNRHTGGTGLGLYIARELAERQGGSLRLRNREGSKGLQASVRLPSAA